MPCPALAETEDAEEEALVVREKLLKLHKLQEKATKKAHAIKVKQAMDAKVVDLQQAEIAKVVELLEVKKKNLNHQPNGKLEDLQEIDLSNSKKIENQRKLKEVENAKVQDDRPAKERKDPTQAEPINLKSVVEAVSHTVTVSVGNCVLQQKQNLLNIKSKTGGKSERRGNRMEVDFDCLFKEKEIRSEVDKNPIKVNTSTVIDLIDEAPEKKEEAGIREEVKPQEKDSTKTEMEMTTRSVSDIRENRDIQIQKEDIELNTRRVSDIRDCDSSNVVIILDAQRSSKVEEVPFSEQSSKVEEAPFSELSTKVKVPFSPNSFFSKLSKEARRICTSLQQDGRKRKERRKDKNGASCDPLERLQHAFADNGGIQERNSREKDEQTILGGSREDTADEEVTHHNENQPTSVELVVKDASITSSIDPDPDQQRREEIQNSVGGIFLVVLVLWLFLESSVDQKRDC